MMLTYNIDCNEVVAQWGFVFTVPSQLLSNNPKTEKNDPLSFAVKIKITQKSQNIYKTFQLHLGPLTFISFSFVVSLLFSVCVI